MENSFIELDAKEEKIFYPDYKDQNIISNPKFKKWCNNIKKTYKNKEYNICYCKKDNIYFLELISNQFMEHKCPNCNIKHNQIISDKKFYRNKFLYLFIHQSEISNHFIRTKRRKDLSCIGITSFICFWCVLLNTLFSGIIIFYTFISLYRKYFFELITISIQEIFSCVLLLFSYLIYSFLFIFYILSFLCLNNLNNFCDLLCLNVLYYLYDISLIIIINDSILILYCIFYKIITNVHEIIIFYFFRLSCLIYMSYYFFFVKILIKRK